MNLYRIEGYELHIDQRIATWHLRGTVEARTPDEAIMTWRAMATDEAPPGVKEPDELRAIFVREATKYTGAVSPNIIDISVQRGSELRIANETVPVSEEFMAKLKRTEDRLTTPRRGVTDDSQLPHGDVCYTPGAIEQSANRIATILRDIECDNDGRPPSHMDEGEARDCWEAMRAALLCLRQAIAMEGACRALREWYNDPRRPAAHFTSDLYRAVKLASCVTLTTVCRKNKP